MSKFQRLDKISDALRTMITTDFELLSDSDLKELETLAFLMHYALQKEINTRPHLSTETVDN